MTQDYYLKISRASDLENPKERLLYRVLEMVPAAMSFGTLILIVLVSWRFPTFAALGAILFSLYWFCRTLYMMFHLAGGYKKMRAAEKIHWLEKLKAVGGWESLYHLIAIPTYKESYEILAQTLLALQNSDYPKEKMIVVVGFEQSAKEESQKKTQLLEREFGKSFFRFLITYHPANIAREMAGKGSNETWALRRAVEEIVAPLQIPTKNVIVSSFDADTVVFPQYFACLAFHYLACKDPLHTSFQPIPLFLNNIWDAPDISRIFSFSSTFWHTMNQERPEKLITFSSHSMSLRALVDVGFKQTNVVSDDSRIFWQCFLHYNGNYKVEPLNYPISMDANVGKGFLQTMAHMYKQQRRWAYGVADIPYFLFGFLKNKKIPFKKEFSLGFELVEGHWTWATASIILFAFGWLPLLIGGHHFSQTVLSYMLPRLTSKILTLAMVGLITSMVISIRLLPPQKIDYGKWRIASFIVQWFLFPFIMVFFTALPSLDAQLRLFLGKYMGFWPTPKFRPTPNAVSL